MRNRLIVILKYSLLTVSLIGILFFVFRKNIYEYLVSSIQKKMEHSYHCQLLIKEIYPEGLTGISLKQLLLIPEGKDTLLNADEIKCSIDLLPLLTGRLSIHSLSLNKVNVNAINTLGKNNFSFLFNKTKKSTNQSEKNYAKMLDRIISASFSYIPEKLDVKEVDFILQDSTESYHIKLPSVSCENEKLYGELLVNNHSGFDKIIFSGSLQKRKQRFSGKLYGDSSAVVLPFVNEKFKLQCRFDTLFVSLKDKDWEDDSLSLTGEAYVHNLFVKHPKLDSNAIGLHYADFSYDFKICKEGALINFPKIVLNKINISLCGGIDRRGEGLYSLKAKMNKISAQDFFSSLPEGLFESFQGIKCKGNIEYKLEFAIDLAQPDSVHFDSRMLAEDFKIQQYGITDFGKMNSSFTYTAYEKGKPYKTFIVGPSNSEFTPIENISPYLRNAVMQSEDGSFFVHKGFREDAFKMAIADNVKKGRFARGGSTISMQLVKNVFLSRKKTIARKLEESLIVWIIENQRITSKSRMYEVYLNVIEWGPGVYGIYEGAKYYFNKKPSELTIEESIYMASIIPRPKAFKWSFDENGNLKSYLASYFKKMGGLLKRREIITEEQQLALVANVSLKGPARALVVRDSIAVDSLQGLDDDE